MSSSASIPARGAGFRATLREALAARERDYTSEPIRRAVVLLAIPMMLEMLMESVFAVVDVYFVARLGVDAMAAVGLTEALLAVVYAIAAGVAMATTALIARRIGEKDREGAADAAVQAIGLGLLVAALIAVPGVIWATDLLRLMGGSTSLVAGGAGYLRVSLASNGTIILLFVMNAVFRGAGDAALAMRVLWLANGINLVLDPCLIYGWGPLPAWGLTGAAVATAIGRGVGVAYQLVLLGRGRGAVRLGRRHLRWRGAVLRRLVRVSLGGVGQYLIATASWVFLVRLVGGFGSAAGAGYPVASRIIIFALMPSWGVANAAATLVGQNLGAGRPDRAEAAVWRTGLYNAGLLSVVAVVFIVWARPLLTVFTAEPAVLAHGAVCLRVVAYGYGFYAFGMVVVQAFNGAGDTAAPLRINLACYWCFQIPLAWTLAHRTALGVHGVFAAITIAEIAMTVTAILVFRRGGWRDRRI